MKLLAIPLTMLMALTIHMNTSAAEPSGREPIHSFAELDGYAQQLSAEPFEACPSLPESIGDLSYDQYRLIAFRPEQAIWWNEGPAFWFEMFHRGFVHRNKVSIHIATETAETRIPFDPKYFEYRGPLAEAKIPPDTGFAGLKIVGRFPGRDDGQEMLTFLGASYFRARTAQSVYGTSARGLAINSATNGPEEFPAFREFWVLKPTQNAKTLTVLALLESASVTGAYRFQLDPRKTRTVVEVKARLYFRREPEKLGLAPLTSMWLWGDGLAGPPKDPRPSVHDADGLLIHSGEDEWTWRALSRQSYPSLSRFPCERLRGFGLLQRDTTYSHYQDDEAQYDRRPSIWIEPATDWGPGAVELLELNGAHEGIDNIAAFWVPDKEVPLGEAVELAYKLHIFRGQLPQHDLLAKAVNTELVRREELIDFAVTFRGSALRELAAETPVSLKLSTVRGTVESQHVRRMAGGDWQALVSVRRENTDPKSVEPIEVRMTMFDADRQLSETWCYLCAPRPPPYKFPAVYTRIE